MSEVLSAVFLALSSLVFFWGSLKTVRHMLRMRRHGRRTAGVIVGHQEMIDRSNTLYAAVLRFTTEDGRTVEAINPTASRFRPKIGRHIPVIYDPADPQGTGKSVRVSRIDYIIAPLFFAGGVLLLFSSATLLARNT